MINFVTIYKDVVLKTKQQQQGVRCLWQALFAARTCHVLHTPTQKQMCVFN